jgi:AcrR family transcriptional regulator
MTDTLDRRVRRSRRQLANALLALVVEKGYDAITIQEIADRADLNRATFYLHFNGKEELLIAALRERFDELVSAMDALPPSDPPWANAAYDLLLFEHIAGHAALYKMLLGEHGLGLVIHQVIAYIAQVIERDLSVEMPAGTRLDAPPPVVSHFYAGALYALIKWWLDQGMPYTPAEMAAYTGRLCTEGVLGVLNRDGVAAGGPAAA